MRSRLAIIGSGDCPQDLYVAYGAELVGAAPDINEASAVRWFPLADLPGMIRSGEVVGAVTVVAAYYLFSSRRKAALDPVSFRSGCLGGRPLRRPAAVRRQ